MKKVPVWVGIILVGSAGCGAGLEQLKARASIDLQCQTSSLAIRAIDSATKRVTGCSKEAIYVELFNNARHPTWLLNSSVISTASSQSPARLIDSHNEQATR
jgi:hypothetical protein